MLYLLFPLHFVLYLGHLDYLLDSVAETTYPHIEQRAGFCFPPGSFPPFRGGEDGGGGCGRKGE